MKWITLAALCLVLAACGTRSGREPSVDVSHVDTLPSGYDVNRVIDRKAGVVCYTYQSAIFCLPLSETALEVSE